MDALLLPTVAPPGGADAPSVIAKPPPGESPPEGGGGFLQVLLQMVPVALTGAADTEPGSPPSLLPVAVTAVAPEETPGTEVRTSDTADPARDDHDSTQNNDQVLESILGGRQLQLTVLAPALPPALVLGSNAAGGEGEEQAAGIRQAGPAVPLLVVREKEPAQQSLATLPDPGTHENADQPRAAPPGVPGDAERNDTPMIDRLTAFPAPDDREGTVSGEGATTADPQQLISPAEPQRRETVKASDLADGLLARWSMEERRTVAGRAAASRTTERQATFPGEPGRVQKQNDPPAASLSPQPAISQTREESEERSAPLRGMLQQAPPGRPDRPVSKPTPSPEILVTVTGQQAGTIDRKEGNDGRRERTVRVSVKEISPPGSAASGERRVGMPVVFSAHEQQEVGEESTTTPLRTRGEGSPAVMGEEQQRSSVTPTTTVQRPALPVSQGNQAADAGAPKAGVPVQNIPSAPERTEGNRIKDSGLGAFLTARTQELTPELSRSVMDQVVRQLHLQVDKASSEMRLRLDPPSLGEVTLTVRMEDGRMQAQIDVAHASVKTALESQMPQLRQSLSGNGIEVQRIDVFTTGQAMSREAGDGRGDHQPRRRENNRNPDAMEAVEHYQTARRMGYNTIEIVM